MTDNIARWAIEAGWWTLSRILRVRLERFAVIVAESEREACAELCEQWNASHPEALAAAIRARSNT